MRTTPQRRLTELRAKASSLGDELAAWTQLTNDSPPLKRHQSQIRLLNTTLSGLLAPVQKLLDSQPSDTDILDKGVNWESEILAAHSIWEVFRAKYVLRQNDLFRDYLAACDDLAWECYQPALKRFAPGKLKEPPLVYLSSTWSPFAQSRDSSFQNEVRAAGRGFEKLGADNFQRVLTHLPIPLVSLPWYQLQHLPGAIILAHEVGHVVERDFGLTGSLAASLDAAKLAMPEAWNTWASEIFADVYGSLAMGPAFAGALMDLMATSRSAVTNERQTSRPHPTPPLRLEIVLTVLADTGFAADAQRLRAIWEASYPPPSAMDDFMADARSAARAVMKGPYDGKALTDVIAFQPSDMINKIRLAAGQGQRTQLEPYSDPRYLFAASQMLHEDPLPGQKADAFKLLVAQAMRKGANQYRSGGKVVPTKAELDAELVAREKQASDEVAALRALLAELSN